MGERSTPVISAPGCSVGAFVREIGGWDGGGEGEGRTVRHVHAPDSRAASEVEDSLGVGDGREV